MTFVTTKLYGRGANQAFQISTAIATALRHNVPYLIPKFTGGDPVYFNHLNLPEFKPEEHKVRHIERERRPRYEKIRYRPAMQLDGYWQCFKHFEDFRSEILDAFKWEWELKKDIVSIHVRRGDYVNNTAFPLLADTYYRQAVTYFKERGYDKFLVVSDDTGWCKKYFDSFEANFFYWVPDEGYLSGNAELAALYDMQLQSQCEHNIVANSSFSFYAAWMNRNPDKIVVCPSLKNMFSGVNKDMIPNEWKQIQF
jgi:hypothetical protein